MIVQYMEQEKVKLLPLLSEDCEQFILDNQWAFKYGAQQEFWNRHHHVPAVPEYMEENWSEDDEMFVFRKEIVK